MIDQRCHPDDRIGNFTVLCQCGAGAFGQVYLVRDGEGKTRALKVLSADRRGERELDGLLRFRKVAHPNLLRIDRLSSLPDGRLFYTMDAADNAATAPDYAPDTLARRMRERGTLPPEELKRIMLELAAGLAELHRSHLLHRDIKPENILFVNGRATLADAGAVGEAGGTTFVGTPEYLHPDVCLQKRTFTATDDCYALGKVLYSALTGEAPGKFPSTPRTLAPEAAALFRTAVRACTPPGVSAYRFRELLEHPEKAASSRKRRRIAFAAAAVVLSFLALAAALFTSPAMRKKPAPPPAAPEPRRSVETPAANSAVRRGEKTPPPSGGIVIREIRPTRRNGAELLSEMEDKDAELRARIKRVKSPKVTPVDEKRQEQKGQGGHGERGRAASGTDRTGNSPTLEELLAKYERSAEEQRIVDRWLAEYVSWVRRISQAGLRGNKTEVAKLLAEMKSKLPYGITDFCRDEIGIKKLLAAVSQGRASIDGQRLELLLRHHRDELKKLLARLPADELAKWR